MKSTSNYMVLVFFLRIKILSISVPVFSLLTKLGEPFHQIVLNDFRRPGFLVVA
jgi:hypothetical protein